MGSQETNREMSQDLRLQAGVGVLNLQRRVEVEVEVEVEGTLLPPAAAAPTLLYSELKGRKYQTRGILQFPPAGLDWTGLGPTNSLLHIYLHEITSPSSPSPPGGGEVNIQQHSWSAGAIRRVSSLNNVLADSPHIFHGFFLH